MKSRFRYLLIAPVLIFLGVFYFYPLASIFGLSLFGEGGQGAASLARLFSTPYYAGILWFTTWQALLSTLLTLLLALPGAYVFANFDFRGKDLIQSLTAIPFVLPTVVVAAAFQALLGRGGLVNAGLMKLFGLAEPLITIEQTVWFFLLAHVFYNYTVVLRIVGGFWAGLPRDLTEAARLLGASPAGAFFRVTLPLLAPPILAASLLVFVFCFTSFGVVLILGGSSLATVEVEIYRQAVYLFNLPLAAVLSLVQIVFTFGLMAVYTRFEGKTAVSLMPGLMARTRRAARSIRERLFAGANALLMASLLGAPLAALVLGSVLTEGGFSLVFYRALAHNPTQSILYISPLEALLNSLALALTATLIALFMGYLAAAFLAGPRGRGGKYLDPLFMLPLSTSAVTLGFGFIIALDEPPLNLRTSWILPALAHALVAFPFVIRSLLPAWRSIPGQLREAAACLGASPFRIWRTVDWPVLGRALAVGAVFSFVISLGEFGATVFVARPQTPTLPLAIYRFLTHPGSMNYGQALAMSCLLMAVTGFGFLTLDRIKLISGGR